MDQSCPRVLMIAEACNPEWTSVPLVGFNIYDAVAAYADVTLVTQVRNRPALERRFGASRRIEFIDSEALAVPFHKLGRILTLGRGLGWTTRQAMMWIPYLYFEKLVWKRFKDELLRGEFDLIHRVTPLTPTYPSPIASWCEVPFVMGPLNGGLPWPKGTGKVRLAEMEIAGYFRSAYKVLPYVQRTYKRAARILVGSRYTESQLPRNAKARAYYLPENGIDPGKFNPEGRTPPSKIAPFRILYVGRLVPLKAVDLLIRAIGDSPRLKDAKLVIVGDGPEKDSLQELAVSLKIDANIEWLGWLEQSRIVEFYRTSSVFALPSLKEFGGAVVLEALACGLPCVVLDYGGPSEFVSNDVGLRVPMGDRKSISDGFRIALERLANDGEQLDAMSLAAALVVQDSYTWRRKAQLISTVYDAVCREKNTAVG